MNKGTRNTARSDGHRCVDRRHFIAGAAGGTGALLLSGCDRLSQSYWFTQMLDSAESLTRRVQEVVAPPSAVSSQYTKADLSQHFRSNGTQEPADAEYQQLARNGFKDWRLELGGLVDRPMHLSLTELRVEG